MAAPLDLTYTAPLAPLPSWLSYSLSPTLTTTISYSYPTLLSGTPTYVNSHLVQTQYQTQVIQLQLTVDVPSALGTALGFPYTTPGGTGVPEGSVLGGQGGVIALETSTSASASNGGESTTRQGEPTAVAETATATVSVTRPGEPTSTPAAVTGTTAIQPILNNPATSTSPPVAQSLSTFSLSTATGGLAGITASSSSAANADGTNVPVSTSSGMVMGGTNLVTVASTGSTVVSGVGSSGMGTTIASIASQASSGSIQQTSLSPSQQPLSTMTMSLATTIILPTPTSTPASPSTSTILSTLPNGSISTILTSIANLHTSTLPNGLLTTISVASSSGNGVGTTTSTLPNGALTTIISPSSSSPPRAVTTTSTLPNGSLTTLTTTPPLSTSSPSSSTSSPSERSTRLSKSQITGISLGTIFFLLLLLLSLFLCFFIRRRRRRRRASEFMTGGRNTSPGEWSEGANTSLSFSGTRRGSGLEVGEGSGSGESPRSAWSGVSGGGNNWGGGVAAGLAGLIMGRGRGRGRDTIGIALGGEEEDDEIGEGDEEEEVLVGGAGRGGEEEEEERESMMRERVGAQRGPSIIRSLRKPPPAHYYDQPSAQFGSTSRDQENDQFIDLNDDGDDDEDNHREREEDDEFRALPLSHGGDVGEDDGAGNSGAGLEAAVGATGVLSTMASERWATDGYSSPGTPRVGGGRFREDSGASELTSGGGGRNREESGGSNLTSSTSPPTRKRKFYTPAVTELGSWIGRGSGVVKGAGAGNNTNSSGSTRTSSGTDSYGSSAGSRGGQQGERNLSAPSTSGARSHTTTSADASPNLSELFYTTPRWLGTRSKPAGPSQPPIAEESPSSRYSNSPNTTNMPYASTSSPPFRFSDTQSPPSSSRLRPSPSTLDSDMPDTPPSLPPIPISNRTSSLRYSGLMAGLGFNVNKEAGHIPLSQEDEENRYTEPSSPRRPLRSPSSSSVNTPELMGDLEPPSPTRKVYDRRQIARTSFGTLGQHVQQRGEPSSTSESGGSVGNSSQNHSGSNSGSSGAASWGSWGSRSRGHYHPEGYPNVKRNTLGREPTASSEGSMGRRMRPDDLSQT